MNKPRYYKVQDKEGLVRDVVSGAIVNIDDTAWSNYRASKQIRDKQRFEKEHQKSQINTLQTEVGNLKHELSDIKSLLSKVLEKLNG